MRNQGPLVRKSYLGIDNGVSGTMTLLRVDGEVFHWKTPTKNEPSYTKDVKHINRIDISALEQIVVPKIQGLRSVFAVMERPMVNPQRFSASMSAMRALEATLIFLEAFDISLQYIDSKEWQTALLPHGSKGDTLKTDAVAIAKRLYPKIITRDADSVLIAEYARRKNF